MRAVFPRVTRPIVIALLATACAASPTPSTFPSTSPSAPPSTSPPSTLPRESPTASPGQRVFVVAVDNRSGLPATLVVGDDGMFDGDPTGTVDPSVLPLGITEDVVLGVPLSEGWAIYVNPGPDKGASITWRDVPPDFSGRMPFSIVVYRDGWGSADAREAPGWFGNPLPTTVPSPAPSTVPGVAWAATGVMSRPRMDHTATLLSDGRVLVAGGSDDFDMLAATELYDPTGRSWSTVGRLAVPRSGHTATLLPDGTVLVTGGYDRAGRILASTESFDPDTGTWSAAGTLMAARTAHTATLLADGRVMLAGGSAFGGHGEAMRAVELYDPANGTWTATKRMLDARWGHTATLLPDGRVLVAGGFVSFGALASAELYDPTKESWVATGTMTSARAKFTATLLIDGTVLAAGLGDRRSAEIFNPGKGAWAATGRMTYSRGNYPTATLLPDGRVLMTGGAARDAQGDWLEAFAELYDPASGSWIGVGNPLTARFSHTATLLPDGTMLIVGGHGLEGALATAEIWNPALEAGD